MQAIEPHAVLNCLVIEKFSLHISSVFGVECTTVIVDRTT